MILVRASDVDSEPASHEDPKRPGVLKKVLLGDGEIPEGRVRMVNWACMEPGKAFRPHYHEDMAEVFVGVSGRVRIEIDGEAADLGRGDAVLVPAGAVHTLRNIGGRPAEYVVVGLSREEGGRTVVVNAGADPAA